LNSFGVVVLATELASVIADATRLVLFTFADCRHGFATAQVVRGFFLGAQRHGVWLMWSVINIDSASQWALVLSAVRLSA